MTGTLALAAMVVIVVGFLELGSRLIGDESPVIGALWHRLRRSKK